MTTDSWLPLAEYSIKYQVSISTLRRKIKADDIKYRFDEGKYFILDEMQKKGINAEEHRPSPNSEVQKNSAQKFQPNLQKKNDFGRSNSQNESSRDLSSAVELFDQINDQANNSTINNLQKTDAFIETNHMSFGQLNIEKHEALEKYKENLISSLQNTEMNGSVISAANRLLADLKKAYTQILQEKEEQILQLREETMDLKTLIKVLETENTRLRG